MVNSVSFEDGKKFHSSKKDLWELKRFCNIQAERENISIMNYEKSAERVTTQELRLKKKGQNCWKDALRQAVNHAKINCKNIEELAEHIKINFNIETKIQNKNIKYLHPSQEKFCGGKKLGDDYKRDELEKYFEEKQKMLEAERSKVQDDKKVIAPSRSIDNNRVYIKDLEEQLELVKRHLNDFKSIENQVEQLTGELKQVGLLDFKKKNRLKSLIESKMQDLEKLNTPCNIHQIKEREKELEKEIDSLKPSLNEVISQAKKKKSDQHDRNIIQDQIKPRDRGAR